MQERDSLSTKVEEQGRRIVQLAEHIEDQISKNITLVIREIKHKNAEKSWNDTDVLANTLCGYFSWNNDSFIHDI